MAKKKKEDKKGLIILGAAALWFLMSSAKGSGSGLRSKYYTIEDVQRSNTAQTENITEQFAPLDPAYLDNANIFVRDVLDPLSNRLGGKFDTESWWRSKRLNEEVGGVPGSFHTLALAVDGDDPTNDNRRVVKAMYDYDIPFTEMILYGSWENPTQIHLAYDPNRGQEKELLLKTENGYTTLHWQPLLAKYNAAGVSV